MTEIKSQKPYDHKLILDRREKLSMTGIKEVVSFDENSVAAATDKETIIIKGENLKVGAINVTSGLLEVEGFIHSIAYDASRGIWGKGIVKKIFK
ncbi:MAG: sporulation protein YabP [Clostridiales bacterium]|nr:sporulation protein YabP [Clostridiales bacterium]